MSHIKLSALIADYNVKHDVYEISSAITFVEYVYAHYIDFVDCDNPSVRLAQATGL